MMRSIRQSREGFALAIVLWIVAALLAGIAYFSFFSKENLQITKELDNKLKAKLQAQSLLEALKYYILTADFDSRSVKNDLKINSLTLPRQIILDGREYNITKEISISLQDTSSLIDVFSPNTTLIAKMATDQNKRELFYTLRDSIRDWMDDDNVVSLNGAEEAYYKLKKNLLYGPRNSPAIQSINELRLIKGFDEMSNRQWESLSRYLHYGGDSYINLALLDDKYLGKLLDLNFLEAHTLKTLRDKDLEKFKYMIRKLKNYNDEVMTFFPSFNIKIDLSMRFFNTESIISSTIRFKKNGSNSVIVQNYTDF